MPDIGIKELLESGVHFGHQTRRWNPKMRRFIHGERSGIYIIDLLQTEKALADAREFASKLAHGGGTILFVGTKKQARDAIKDNAEACGMPYVNHRWLGGLLTNFQTINQRIQRLHDLERFEKEGQLELLPTRERLAARSDMVKLQANLGGVKNMKRAPDALFVIDLKTEVIAVKEAQRLRIPIIGLVDTNCDPDGIQYVIPGNDDAMRSCSLVARGLAEVIEEGRSAWQVQEDARRAKEAEELARREAEEKARKEAAEAAAKAEEEVAAAAKAEAVQQAEAAAAAPAEAPAKPAAPAAEAPKPAAEAPNPAAEAPKPEAESTPEPEAAKS